MKFYKDNESTYWKRGVWCLSDEECPDGLESEDCEVFVMEVDVIEDIDDYSSLVEVNFHDCNEPTNSWYSRVVVVDDCQVYDEEFAYEEYGEFYGWIHTGRNDDECFLLGLYDVINLWFNDIDVFGIVHRKRSIDELEALEEA